MNSFGELLAGVAFALLVIGIIFGGAYGCSQRAKETAEAALKKNGAVTRCVTIGGDEHCELVCPSAAPIQEVRKP